MSTAVRLISGSAAAWTRIFVTMLSQIVLVPIYLGYWNAETYGVWIAIQSLVIILTLFDLGHHVYVGYELMRLARVDMVTYCKYVWSSVMIGFIVSIFELSVICLLIFFEVVPMLVGEAHTIDSALASQAGYVLLCGGVNWVATSAISGFFVRSLEPFGHHARLSWWGAIHLIISNTAPAIAVVMGASFLQAGIVLTTVSTIFYIPIYLDMFRLMKREKIVLVKPSWIVGRNNFQKSIGLTGKLILENLRQQGVRLVLAPISGAAALAAFSTMRTGANVALQGMNSITNPLMPDLMRFLHNRDQMRSEAGFGTIWFVIVALLAPAVILLQAIAGPLFGLWTHGRIVFDPALFSTLSLSVLIFAIGQPAVAVVMGNNIIRPQLILSGLSAVIVIALVVLLVPPMGLVGAGIAIVVAEMAAVFGYVLAAKTWLNANGLAWPTKSFVKTATSVALSAVSMIGIALFPGYTWIICLSGLTLCGWTFFSYWFTLPDFVREKVHIMVRLVVTRVRNIVAPARS